MKRTFLNLKMVGCMLAVVFVVLTMAACGSDEKEDTSTINLNEAVGTWMCISSTDTYQGVSYTGLLTGAEITIKNDGSYTSTASSFGKQGSFTINGNTITAKNSSGDTFVVTVSIKDNTMTWQGTSSTGVSFRYVFTRE
ncbi:MAG: lipocalin family protein [Bacteroidaceae bacterium]|nr:lipocalin family protein [Bacteroidaceae bacterium]